MGFSAIITIKAPYFATSGEADRRNLKSEKTKETPKLQFDERRMLEFHETRTTSDVGLLVLGMEVDNRVAQVYYHRPSKGDERLDTLL